MKLTPENRQAIIDWHQQKRSLGTMETQAQKYGVSVKTIENVIQAFRESNEPSVQGLVLSPHG
jgi:transposase